MTKKKSKSVFLSRLAMGLILALAVIYFLYHVISLFTFTKVSTIISGVTTQSNTLDGRGYVFRDEKVLNNENSGAVDYFVKDGEKVAKGQKIAAVYERSIVSRSMINVIDKYIELLEKSNSDIENNDLVDVRQEANDTYYALMKQLSAGDDGSLSNDIEEMMIVLNKITALSDEEDIIAKTLTSLKKQRERYFVGASENGYADNSGYFYYSSDGYERFFTLKAADSLTADMFYTLEDAVLAGKAMPSAKSYGKLADGTVWKLAVPLSDSEAKKLGVDKSYELTFPENNMTKMTMTLEAKIVSEKNKEVICMFKCNKSPAGFTFDRIQDVEISVSSISGIYIPRSALASVDGMRGVYVLRGSVVHFRRVEIIYSGFDYCIVRADVPDDGGEYYYLGNNELIITNGKNLFDGRILNT